MQEVKTKFDFASLNKVQQAASSLITSDMRFLYTVIIKSKFLKCNYIPSLFPYIGVIIDGAEDWVKAINNSTKNKIPIPVFTKDEERYYEQLRGSIKLWENDYNNIFAFLKNKYSESDEYFGSICKPFAKKFHIYDIYGVDTANGVLCGNTILCQYYTPCFKYGDNNGEYIKRMSEIAGKYVVSFNAFEELLIDEKMKFDTRDYGGFVKSPIGNTFSDKFVMLSILCQINFILLCVEQWVKEEVPAKLRFAYLLYFSLVHIIPQLNAKVGTQFKLNDEWYNTKFRNSMAHYKLGINMSERDLIANDIMYGLTIKIFGKEYYIVKESIYNELKKLSMQLGDYLKIKNCIPIDESQ